MQKFETDFDRYSYNYVGFYYKSIRWDPKDFNQTRITDLLGQTRNELRRAKTEEEKYKFRRRIDGSGYEVVSIAESQAQLQDKSSCNWTKKNSMSVASIRDQIYPPVFGHDKRNVLVGELWFTENLEGNELLFPSLIMRYDLGTVGRINYFIQKIGAKINLRHLIDNQSLFFTVSDLIQFLKDNPQEHDKFNEVLTRNNFIAGDPRFHLAIFTDNLQARLIAQLRSCDWLENLGLDFIHITFYQPKSREKLRPYFLEQQQQDLELGLSSDDPEILAIAKIISTWKAGNSLEVSTILANNVLKNLILRPHNKLTTKFIKKIIPQDLLSIEKIIADLDDARDLLWILGKLDLENLPKYYQEILVAKLRAKILFNYENNEQLGEELIEIYKSDSLDNVIRVLIFLQDIFKERIKTLADCAAIWNLSQSIGLDICNILIAEEQLKINNWEELILFQDLFPMERFLRINEKQIISFFETRLIDVIEHLELKNLECFFWNFHEEVKQILFCQEQLEDLATLSSDKIEFILTFFKKDILQNQELLAAVVAELKNKHYALINVFYAEENLIGRYLSGLRREKVLIKTSWLNKNAFRIICQEYQEDICGWLNNVSELEINGLGSRDFFLDNLDEDRANIFCEMFRVQIGMAIENQAMLKILLTLNYGVFEILAQIFSANFAKFIPNLNKLAREFSSESKFSALHFAILAKHIFSDLDPELINLYLLAVADRDYGGLKTAQVYLGIREKWDFSQRFYKSFSKNLSALLFEIERDHNLSDLNREKLLLETLKIVKSSISVHNSFKKCEGAEIIKKLEDLDQDLNEYYLITNLSGSCKIKLIARSLIIGLLISTLILSIGMLLGSLILGPGFGSALGVFAGIALVSKVNLFMALLSGAATMGGVSSAGIFGCRLYQRIQPAFNHQTRQRVCSLIRVLNPNSSLP